MLCLLLQAVACAPSPSSLPHTVVNVAGSLFLPPDAAWARADLPGGAASIVANGPLPAAGHAARGAQLVVQGEVGAAAAASNVTAWVSVDFVDPRTNATVCNGTAGPLRAGDNFTVRAATVRGPLQLWSVARPYLYEARVTLLRGPRPGVENLVKADEQVVPFGAVPVHWRVPTRNFKLRVFSFETHAGASYRIERKGKRDAGPSAGLLSYSSDVWRVCDVTNAAFGAFGDAKHDDTSAIRLALRECDEVLLPAGKSFLTGPLNLTSNQRFVVDGTLLASTNPADYPMVAPLISYGWSIDSNCFPFLVPEVVTGALNYQAIINSWNASNVTVTGSGVIDGQGQPWWERCTKCHYRPPIGEWPHANSSCLEAGRPMLLQFTLVTGLNVHGSSLALPLTLQNSPFWTFTTTYSQNIQIKDLVILAPMNVIGNTDGIDISSSRNALIENVMINNSDDGICMNSGAWEFGMNLAIPTENVVVRNITCPAGGRGGFRVGIQPGGVRNVTYLDSVLHGERGLSLLGALGGGGYIHDVLFANISNPRGISFGDYANPSILRPGNRYLPKVWNVEFRDITDNRRCGNCPAMANGSVCPNVTFTGSTQCGPNPTPRVVAAAPVPTMRYGCKRNAIDQFGSVFTFPWPVCIPLDAPVNVNSSWPNWGPVEGNFPTLRACKASGCK